MRRSAHRITAALLTAALLFGTVGCGKRTVQTQTQTAAESAAAPQTAETQTETQPETTDALYGSDVELPKTADEADGTTQTPPDEPAPQTQPDAAPQPAAAPQTQPTAAAAAETQTELTVHVHMYTTKTVAATCTKQGYTVTYCSCGDAQYTDVTDPLGHDFVQSVETKAATCSENGTAIRTCARCGETIKESTPKREHRMTDFTVVKAATGAEAGVQTRRCTVCGTVETVEIPKVRPYADPAAADALLRLVNASRAQAGVGALTMNHTYDACALQRANEIRQSFSHTRPNGQKFYTVFDEQGLARPGSYGENIQYGTNQEMTAATIHNSFMNSQGHRENVLNANYTSASFCILYTQTDTYVVELFFG